MLVAGVVGRAHGLDGSFHVARARAALLDAASEVTVAGETRRITRRAGTDERPILRLEGCSTRAEAEALRGGELLVPRSAAEPLDEDEFWEEDLVGCAVVDGPVDVGVVRGLLAYPSCDVLEVERPGGGELLVPLVRDAVRSVDVEAGRIDVSLAFLGEA